MINTSSFRIAWMATVASLSLGCGSSDSDDGDPGSSGSKIFVADEDDGTVSVLDHDTNQRRATIALPMDGDMYMPHNVQSAPDGSSVWVVAPGMVEGGMERAFVIDPTTDQITATIDLGTELHVAHVVLDPSSSHAYITANEAGAVLEIDAATHTVARSFDLGAGSGPHGARFCAGALWVAAMGARALLRVDLASGAVQSVDVGGVAVQTACMPDERYVLASLYDTKEVVRYEIATGTLARIALPAEAQGPVQLYPSPDSTALWVCDQGVLEGRPPSNKLYRIDVEAALVSGSVEVGQGAHGVVVSDDGTRAYVTNLLDATVSVVDTVALQTIATTEVGSKPNGISHWHGSGGMP